MEVYTVFEVKTINPQNPRTHTNRKKACFSQTFFFKFSETFIIFLYFLYFQFYLFHVKLFFSNLILLVKEEQKEYQK